MSSCDFLVPIINKQKHKNIPHLDPLFPQPKPSCEQSNTARYENNNFSKINPNTSRLDPIYQSKNIIYDDDKTHQKMLSQKLNLNLKKLKPL